MRKNDVSPVGTTLFKFAHTLFKRQSIYETSYALPRTCFNAAKTLFVLLALFRRKGFSHVDGTSIQVCAIQVLDGVVAFVIVTHHHVGKAQRLARGVVAQDSR